MFLVKSFKKLHQNIILILYPIVFDLLSLAIGLYIIGFYGEKIISIRIILEMGLPSLSHLSNIPLFINNTDFLTYLEELYFFTLFIVIIAVIIGAFLQGGYIGHLYSIAEDKKFSFSQFINEGKRNWIQFVILEIIVFLGKIAVTAFLALFFGIIGVFASLVFFITLRIIFIYLEFTMVVDRTGIILAIKRSRKYLVKSLFSTLALVLIMYIIASLLSLVLHYYWSPLIIIGLIVMYAYIMSGMQLALMLMLCKAKLGNKIIK